MLPKVATHFLHTTSRAAAQAVQTPLRNVLQTGSSTSSNLGNRNGAGGSNWGGQGTGAGSTKQNTGSRYYSFNSAGRAVSQANAVSAVLDGTFSQADENDEHMSHRVVVINTQPGTPTKRPRIRSSSVSLTKAESLGVLKTLQLQGRSRFLHTSIDAASHSQIHSLSSIASSRPRRNSTSSSDGLDRPSSPVQNFSTATYQSGSQITLPDAPARPRRNSTSSTTSSHKELLDVTLDQLEHNVHPPRSAAASIGDFQQPLQSRRSSVSSFNESEQSQEASSVGTKPTTPPLSPQVQRSKSPGVSRPPTPTSPSAQPSKFQYLIDARDSKDVHRVAEAVARFRSSSKGASTEDFNIALEALYTTRVGESSMPMLETYNDMIKHSIHPNVQTYTLLLMSLTERDFELGLTIKELSSQMKRQQTFDVLENLNMSALQSRLDILQSEFHDNFASIISLYSVAKNTVTGLPILAFRNLLCACTYHQNVDAAAQIFRHAELTFPKLEPMFYRFMIKIYGRENNIAFAEQIFHRYIAAGREARLDVAHPEADLQKQHILVWNSMIDAYFQCRLPEKAIGLLDLMMNSSVGHNLTLADTPFPASSTYSSILKGFCDNGDIQSALVWYDRLSKQGIEAEDRFCPSDQPIQPDLHAKLAMIEALGANGHIAEVNKIFSTLDFAIEDVQRVVPFVFNANIQALKNVTDEGQAKDMLQYLSAEVLPRVKKARSKYFTGVIVASEYVRWGLLDDSISFFTDFFNQRLAEHATLTHPVAQVKRWSLLRMLYSEFSKVYFEAAVERNAVSLESALVLIQLSNIVGITTPRMANIPILHAYGVAKSHEQLPLDKFTTVHWQEMLKIALRAEDSDDIPGYAFGGILSLMEDFAKYGVDVQSLPRDLMKQAIQHLISVHGPHSVAGAFERFGSVYVGMLEDSRDFMSLTVDGTSDILPENIVLDRTTRRELYPQGGLIITPAQTKIIDDALKHNNVRAQVLFAYDKLQAGLKARKVPALRVLGRLIQGLGRQRDVEKVHEVYGIAQDALKGLELQQDALREGWICVEDSMIIALAHAGDIDNAHVHRLRLIEQGATPSADAYGALILYVKDTTDDASNAMTLFREAVQINAEMNIYLYNNIISKLAKARKADNALELFQRMKEQGIRPTSITYGALIGACARVGDVQSSEALFSEMVEQKNFKPRVPPYNTMMQLYTMTKPNRERTLWFYDLMKTAGVKPTAHTYKLLLDAYGSIEPVDITAMEATFEQLKNDNEVEVQGTHYASLINAYGCVQRDLDKAIVIFDSIASTSGSSSPKPRSSSSSSSSALDAVVFEAVINVLVSHRRTDLIPEYITKMTTAGIHMTAYIANFLIKGYAIVGELDKAREIFESLVDPPTGVAAPNNHAPHDPSVWNPIGCMEPVYREPSTWEAMVRAELGSGYRDRALDLLHRLKSRQYPEAVYNRISGVMVDHSSLVL